MTSLSAASTEKVDGLFARWDRPGSPGCALGVIHDGAMIYQRGYGLADLERQVPITTQSIFDIGSTAKQFTATIILILANRGQLALDDSLRSYVPEMAAYADQITLRHLLHHTSGLRDYLELMELMGFNLENLYDEQYLLDLIIRQQALNFPPGDRYTYSNSGYFMLGIVAQRVTQQHLTDLIAEQIFKPLGMLNSTFNKDYQPIVKGRALSYDPAGDEGGFVNAIALSGGFGDGAILSNIPDLFLWDQNFYQNRLNNHQPDLMSELHRRGVLNNGESIEYAAGLEVSRYRGLELVLHGGGWAGYRTELLRFPEQRFSVICLANLGNIDPTALALQVADIYLADFMEPAELSAKDHQTGKLEFSEALLQARSGVFTNPQSGDTWILSVQDGALHLQAGQKQYPLQATSPTSYALADFPSCLEFSDDSHFTYRIIGAAERHFGRESGGPWTPANLDEYRGLYRSSELGVDYVIDQQDSQLAFHHQWRKPNRLTPALPDVFIGAARLNFERSTNGKVMGFRLSSGRVRDIHFERTDV